MTTENVYGPGHTFISLRMVFPLDWLSWHTSFGLYVNYPGLPEGSYAIMEFYCPSPECHCEQTIIDVYQEGENLNESTFVATLRYEFNKPVSADNPRLAADELQSEYSELFLKFGHEVSFDFLQEQTHRFNSCARMMKRTAVNAPPSPEKIKLQQIWKLNLLSAQIPDDEAPQ